jgi:hypothetical protein
VLQDDELNGMLNDSAFGDQEDGDVHMDGGVDADAGGNSGRRNELVEQFPHVLLQ